MEIKNIIKDIPGYNNFIKIEPVNEGLSSDKKYYIETDNGQRLLLRLTEIERYDRKKAEYERMGQMAVFGISMPLPIGFGVCNNEKYAYQLLTWCDGENLYNLLPKLSESEQYNIGLKAGEILRKIHAVPISETDITAENWNECYSSFIDASIQSFHDCGVKVEGAEIILDYFNSNRHLLKTRPQCYMHNDYHVGNMMYCSEKQELYIIDWEILLFNNYGDPWKEISMQETPHFSTGMIRGYFDGEPPEEYWSILAFYTSVGAISAIPWAYYGFPDKLGSITNLCADVLKWFDNMRNPVPTWYLKD